MEEMTAVPLFPHPMMPTRIAELALEPKTMAGFKMVIAEAAAAVFRNDLRSIFFCHVSLVLKLKVE